jgi:predicted amidophosphoribosyltransferase
MPIHPAFDALILPRRCVLCRRRADVPVWCAACTQAIAVAASACYRCGGHSLTQHACWPPGTPIAATTTAYSDSLALRRTLHTAAKHDVHDVWESFGATLARRYVIRIAPHTIVFATPSRKASRRAQQDVHCQRLARAFATSCGLPLGPQLIPKRRPARHDPTTQQSLVEGRHVVLVTDMFATGVALWNTAQWLKANGSRTVDVVAVMRQGDHPLGRLLC